MDNQSDFDIIGDIHGQHDKLVALLAKMGYRQVNGAWRHPSRRVLFAGDFVDRGPGQLATLDTVRRMVDAGSALAVMGNHEFNAIAFHAKDPANHGSHLRVRSEKNRRQHAGFLLEVGEDSALHDQWVEWFMTLPLWMENDHLRLVHACWHPAYMEALSPFMGPGNTLTPELVELASRPDAPQFQAVEALCKGLEIDLPDPVSYTDAEGTVRRRTRVRWWDDAASTYRAAALIGPREAAQLPEDPIPSSARVLYDQAKPVFFGHYWFTGTPSILSPKICCVDYSAARDNHPLVAYRYAGEDMLSNDNLVATDPVIQPRPRP